MAYKVGLAVMVVGVIISASSWILRGVFFEAMMKLLTFLGAPEDRAILPPYYPEAGGHFLRFFGAILFACGVCIVSLRLGVELLGLAGNSELTARLKGADKLGAGAVAIGFFGAFSTELSRDILYEIFDYKYEIGPAIYRLQTIAEASALVWLGGLAILTRRVGRGVLGCGWVSKLGLGLVVLGIIGATTDNDDPTTMIFWTVIVGILLVGILLHTLRKGMP